VLGEPFGFWDGVGTAITLIGIALYTLSAQRRAKPRQT
jgi:drug/metabolite transporter (DMT)-like permease